MIFFKLNLNYRFLVVIVAVFVVTGHDLVLMGQQTDLQRTDVFSVHFSEITLVD